MSPKTWHFHQTPRCGWFFWSAGPGLSGNVLRLTLEQVSPIKALQGWDGVCSCKKGNSPYKSEREIRDVADHMCIVFIQMYIYIYMPFFRTNQETYSFTEKCGCETGNPGITAVESPEGLYRGLLKVVCWAAAVSWGLRESSLQCTGLWIVGGEGGKTEKLHW